MPGSVDGVRARPLSPPQAVTIDDEAELVALAQRDRRAFAPLYTRYFDPVYRYCYRRLGSPEAAADATSQTFAKALASLTACRAETFRSWLFAIAHNVLTDGYRSHRFDQPLESAAEVADETPSPEELAVVAEERKTLEGLLVRLQPEQRQILELRLAGLTSKEIATVLGRTPNAIDQAQFRAVNRLRTLLATSAHDRGTEESR
jgi:RNA polymerase sigma-70 factor (ECF subfamily)